MWTATFWKATAERALKTFLQTLLATLTVGVPVVPRWESVVAAAGLAAVAAGYSVISSLLSVLAGDPASPSLVSGPPGTGDRRLG